MPLETFPKSVETQTPGVSGSVSCQDLSGGFEEMPLETLRKIPLPAGVFTETPNTKAPFVQGLSRFFAFPSPAAFDAWLTLFPPLSQEILRDAALFGCTALEKYQARSSAPLIKLKGFSPWDLPLEPWLNLDFLWTAMNWDQAVAGLPGVLRDALRPWFAGPREASLEGCTLDRAAPPEAGVFSNALEIAGSLPLLYEALASSMGSALAGTEDPGRAPKLHLLTRKQIAALRSRCGFKSFPIVYEKAPDALELTARFVLCMGSPKLGRPRDGHGEVKRLAADFFALPGLEEANPPRAPLFRWDYVESHVLTAHLQKKALGWGYYRGPPPSRKVFQTLLTWIARDGRWFSADRLARHILIRGDAFNFVPLRLEDRMTMKADSVTLEGIRCPGKGSGTILWPFTTLRFDLLMGPLFKAYCYLFAALGLLEITQKRPPEPVTVQEKTMPFSLYDALEGVRVTGFGRWCLGLGEERPLEIQEISDAIADRELLLVTVRGSSLERALYLDSIGVRLGEDRWRISPRSFISGCANRGDITERIARFKRLIDPNPAPHWDALFSQVLERAGAVNQNAVPARVYYLGGCPGLMEELLGDPALGSCAMRAEGGLLAVPDKYRKKFLELLAGHGVLWTADYGA